MTEQQRPQESFTHSTSELATLERTAQLAQAAHEVGGRVLVIANAGEEYNHTNGKRLGRPRTSFTGEVPEGSAYITLETNGDTGPVRAKADEIAQQQNTKAEKAA
ncbi:MAG: hypothetical protein U0451_03935 [Candidatus Saccharimonadales bacterium]